VLRPGDEVLVLPSERVTTVASVDSYDGPLDVAFPPMSVTLRLSDELDVSRGDIICRPDDRPALARDLVADVCWMADAPLRPGGRYAIKHATHSARAIVESIDGRLDVTSLRRVTGPAELALNDIGRVRLRTSKPLAFDPYARNRFTGSFILIDEATNDTVGAGMITAP
jgi:sulfate adenylyltransferase subunit 1 (EFTu-like GTPase family)